MDARVRGGRVELACGELEKDEVQGVAVGVRWRPYVRAVTEMFMNRDDLCKGNVRNDIHDKIVLVYGHAHIDDDAVPVPVGAMAVDGVPTGNVAGGRWEMAVMEIAQIGVAEQISAGGQVVNGGDVVGDVEGRGELGPKRGPCVLPSTECVEALCTGAMGGAAGVVDDAGGFTGEKVLESSRGADGVVEHAGHASARDKAGSVEVQQNALHQLAGQ